MEQSNLVDVTGRSPVSSGNVRVSMKRDARRRWRVEVGVFGDADRVGLRTGRVATIAPEDVPTAKELRHAVGLAAASLSRQLQGSGRIDERDAYRGAVEMLDSCLVEMRARGFA